MDSADFKFEMSELRDLVNHETVERSRLEGEVIGLGAKMDRIERDVVSLSGRFNTFADTVLSKFDKLSKHLGVPE